MSDLSVIKKLKVAELKAALSARGLAVKGKKDELIKRLAEAMEQDENSPSEEPEVAEEVTEEDPSGEVSQESEDPPDTSQQTEEQEDESEEQQEELEMDNGAEVQEHKGADESTTEKDADKETQGKNLYSVILVENVVVTTVI